MFHVCCRSCYGVFSKNLLKPLGGDNGLSRRKSNMKARCIFILFYIFIYVRSVVWKYLLNYNFLAAVCVHCESVQSGCDCFNNWTFLCSFFVRKASNYDCPLPDSLSDTLELNWRTFHNFNPVTIPPISPVNISISITELNQTTCQTQTMYFMYPQMKLFQNNIVIKLWKCHPKSPLIVKIMKWLKNKSTYQSRITLLRTIDSLIMPK